MTARTAEEYERLRQISFKLHEAGMELEKVTQTGPIRDARIHTSKALKTVFERMEKLTPTP